MPLLFLSPWASGNAAPIAWADALQVSERPHHPDFVRERRQPAAMPSGVDCEPLYDALPNSSGDDLVTLLQSADYSCIRTLDRHDSAALQFAIATEPNVLNLAGAIPDVVENYDGSHASAGLRNLMGFLIEVEDIRFWCVQGSSSGTCADEIWREAQPWSIAPGSDVHAAVTGAINAISLNRISATRRTNMARRWLNLAASFANTL